MAIVINGALHINDQTYSVYILRIAVANEQEQINHFQSQLRSIRPSQYFIVKLLEMTIIFIAFQYRHFISELFERTVQYSKFVLQDVQIKIQYIIFIGMQKSESRSPPEDTGHQTKGPTSKDCSKSSLSLYIRDEEMIRILNRKGITQLLPVQHETFNLIYKGEDVIAKDRTGSGKTLAFAIPIIMRMREQRKFEGEPCPRFLIVLPTRELSIQVAEQINSLRYKNRDDFIVASIYGGTWIKEHIELLRKGADIIVGTPGRIIDLIQRRAIKLQFLEVICLDEADEMLNIGFKEDIQKIFRYITASKKSKIQCLMFSATIPEWIWKMSDYYQSKTRQFVDMINDGNTKTSKTVEHCCLYADDTNKEYCIGPLIQYFLGNKQGKIIVFCETKREVDRIGSSRLIPASVAMLHGDFSQLQREQVFHDFKKGGVECLIATNVAARGLDFPEIDLIIQLQPPSTTDAYIHRSGRTGRAGKYGYCVTLYNYKEEHLMVKIEKEAKIIFNHINPDDLRPLKKQNLSKFSRYGPDNGNKGQYNENEDWDAEYDERRQSQRNNTNSNSRQANNRNQRPRNYR